MPGSGPACLVCRAKSDQVVPRRPNLLTHFPDSQAPALTRQDTTWRDIWVTSSPDRRPPSGHE